MSIKKSFPINNSRIANRQHLLLACRNLSESRLNKIFTLLVLVSCVFIHGCGESVEPEDLLGQYADGTITATKNEEPWEANGFIGEGVRFPDTYVLLVGRFNEQFFRRESFNFSQLINNRIEKEVYPMVSTSEQTADTVRASYNTVLDDGDVIGDFYEIVRKDNVNWIEFTEYDPVTRRLKGRFEIHLKLSEDEIKVEPDAEPTIDFVDGTFDVLAPEGFVLE